MIEERITHYDKERQDEILKYRTPVSMQRIDERYFPFLLETWDRYIDKLLDDIFNSERKVLSSGNINLQKDYFEILKKEIADIVIAQLNTLYSLIINKPLITKDRKDHSISQIKVRQRSYRQSINNRVEMLQEEIKLETSKQSIGNTMGERELEQKFKILFSQPQIERDFKYWCSDAIKEQYPIAILFVDIDNFKVLNTKYTEKSVDDTIFPDAQYLLKTWTSHHGGAYRYGGDEFVVILPNHDENEAVAFGEKIRIKFEKHNFTIGSVKERLTISVGIALYPTHGKDLNEVLSIANKAERGAKDKGGNSSIFA